MNIDVHYTSCVWTLHTSWSTFITYMSIKLDAINVFICKWLFSSKISLMSISVDNYQIDPFYKSENCLFYTTLSVTASNDQAGFFPLTNHASAG